MRQLRRPAGALAQADRSASTLGNGRFGLGHATQIGELQRPPVLRRQLDQHRAQPAAAGSALKAGKDINYEGVGGPVDFDENGDPTEAYIGIYQYGADNNIGFSDITVSQSRNLATFRHDRATSSSMPPPTQFAGTFYGDYIAIAQVDNFGALDTVIATVAMPSRRAARYSVGACTTPWRSPRSWRPVRWSRRSAPAR